MRRSLCVLLIVLLLLCCAPIHFCYPTKPLNERSTDLAWQAWLLVDQNNRPGGDFGLLRRRITPKSVFVVPTFSPDALPACAEGYKSDAMGRCVKIIKINEAAHLDFLLQKLNEDFADYDDGEVVESATTPGPFQLNIPLGDDNNDDLMENETELALVVTPARGSHGNGNEGNFKVDIKRNHGGKFSVENVAAIFGVDPDSVETTTIAELTTQSEELRQRETTTIIPTTEETTTLESTTTMETTTSAVTSTESGDETTTVLNGGLFPWAF